METTKLTIGQKGKEITAAKKLIKKLKNLGKDSFFIQDAVRANFPSFSELTILNLTSK